MENKICRICNKPTLIGFLSFGKMPISSAFLKKEDLQKDEFFYNMDVGFCENCKMVQVLDPVPPEKYLVPDEQGKVSYAFTTSTSKVMETHFKDLARQLEKKFLTDNKKAMDIGSNDGTLLSGYAQKDFALGIEPSNNVAEKSIKRGVKTIKEFFTKNLAQKIANSEGKFRVITSTNVTMDIIDLHDFIGGVAALLDDKGIFVTEDPYLLSVLENLSYDQIFDKLFSLTSFGNICNMYNLEIFDSEKIEVHGGSMRMYISKKGVYEKTKRLKEYLKKEKEAKIETLEPYKLFAKKIDENTKAYVNLIKTLKSRGKKIVGYAASLKGTIVQNYCNLDKSLIDYIVDSTPFKQGLYSPGKHIPIVSPEKFRNDNEADYAVLFAWNHAKEIMEKEKSFLERGGKFIVHIPEPKILNPFIIDLKPLKVFHKKDEGYLFETLRSDDDIFEGKFGQNLISFANPGVKKGLHKQKKDVEYTTCIKGNILYIAVKEIESGPPIIEKYIIGESNNVMLKTPPGIWHGYMPLNNEGAIILYAIASPYNPKEPEETKDAYAFGDIWKKE